MRIRVQDVAPPPREGGTGRSRWSSPPRAGCELKDGSARRVAGARQPRVRLAGKRAGPPLAGGQGGLPVR
eukprot:1250173-Pyramimonas_sp.AAC.1